VKDEIETRFKCTEEDILQLALKEECDNLGREFKSIFVKYSISPMGVTFTT
jgi:hypothetical protein